MHESGNKGMKEFKNVYDYEDSNNYIGLTVLPDPV